MEPRRRAGLLVEHARPRLADRLDELADVRTLDQFEMTDSAQAMSTGRSRPKPRWSRSDPDPLDPRVGRPRGLNVG